MQGKFQLETGELEHSFLFQGVEFDSIRGILTSSPLQELKKDQVLIRRGQPNCFLYLLLAGRLRVHLDLDTDPLVVLERGDIVGELSVIDGQPASAHVVADEDCRLMLLEETVLWSLIEHSPSVSRNLLLVLAQRVRDGNERVLTGRSLRREYKRLAVIDPVTGLFNRRWLDAALERDMNLCREGDVPLTLLVIAIDQFRRMVDIHGQSAGRQVLYQVGRRLRDAVGAGEVVARSGHEFISKNIVLSGEGEFVVVLPGGSLASGLSLGERLCGAVNGGKMHWPGGDHLGRPTISTGVVEMVMEHTPEGLKQAATTALLKAQQEGGNQVQQA